MLAVLCRFISRLVTWTERMNCGAKSKTLSARLNHWLSAERIENLQIRPQFSATIVSPSRCHCRICGNAVFSQTGQLERQA
jgi:hypothetical protein